MARSIAARLSHRFQFRIKYGVRNEWVTGQETDLIYVFYWGAKLPEHAGFKKKQIIKEVASWAWMHRHSVAEQLTKDEVVKGYLSDCAAVTTPCAGIYRELAPSISNIVHCPNGVEYSYFANTVRKKDHKGPLIIGWVGSPQDEHKVKGLNEILKPAAKGFDFRISNGRMSRRDLRKFYAEIDVLAIASLHESQPLPLLESMSAGCFPVCTNVGIVPEVVKSMKNGIIVQRSIDSFREAFEWCENNLEWLRSRRPMQSAVALQQDWDIWAPRFGDLFDCLLSAFSENSPVCLTSLRGIVPRDDFSQNIDVLPREFPRCSTPLLWWKTVSLDMGDDFRRFFLGDRFESGLGKNYYDFAESKVRWFLAVINRFSELWRESGFIGAIIKTLKSSGRQFKLHFSRPSKT